MSKCSFYNKGICGRFSRQEGIDEQHFTSARLVSLGQGNVEVCHCSECDALTPDELDALCDPEIMGFDINNLLITCQTCYSDRCMLGDKPICNAESHFWKWKPQE